MPTSLTVNFRCQNKNLATIPATGETPATDGVSINLQEAALPGLVPRASFQVTLPIASDTFIMGGYYTATVIDGAAPGGTSIPCPDPAAQAAPTTTAPTKLPAK
jgi:hypothetical protein